MRVRCLHCHEPLEVEDDGDLSDISCSSCGGSFSLVGEKSTVAGDIGRTLGRFQLIQQVGIGSFGSVWKAHDPELDRTVAVKIPRKGQLSPAESEQFLREARAAAQLKHPHIVAVHEVGRSDDTVYIVSDFVHGATLDDWLTGQQLTPREAALLCAKIADALEHAHQAGVIHRDLKPSNVMLDLNAEPHLMDFGLARRQVGDATVTIDGRILGTPAYMSPEQARGEAHHADRRTDVYSLGVILFRLLTRELPFRGNPQMLIVQILREEPPSPRKLDAKVPRDLETIVLKCLQKNPDRRYATAAEMAKELRRFINGEPILARPIGKIERLGRWCLRNPQIAMLLAALTIVLVGGFAGVTWQMLEARANLVVAKRERLRADAGFRKARAAVDEMLTEVGQERLKDIPEMDPVRQALLEKALAFYEGFLNERSDDPMVQQETAQAYARAASINESLGRHSEAEKAFAQSIQLIEQLLRDSPQNPEYRKDLANSLQGQGKLYYTTGRMREAETDWKLVQNMREQLVREKPGDAELRYDLAAIHNNLAVLFKDTTRAVEAEAAYSKALSVFDELVREHPVTAKYAQYLGNVHNNLALLYSETDRSKSAVNLYKTALEIHNKLVADNPSVTEYLQNVGQAYHNLAWLYQGMGQITDARATYDKALQVRERIANEHPSILKYQSDLAHTLNGIGWLNQSTGKTEDAIATYQKALVIIGRLALTYPSVPQYQNQLARLHHSHGWLYQERDRIADARESYAKAVTIYERLVREYPAIDEYQHNLAQIHHELGMLYGDKAGDPNDAKRSYESAMEIREQLVRKNPDRAANLDNLAWTYHNLANLIDKSGAADEAEVLRTKAIALREKLVQAHPDVPLYAVGLAASYAMSGKRKHESAPEEAIEMYSRCIAILEPLSNRESPPRDAHETLEGAHLRRAGLLTRLERYEDAIGDWERTIALKDKTDTTNVSSRERRAELASIYRTLARCYRACDRTTQAEQAEDSANQLEQNVSNP